MSVVLRLRNLELKKIRLSSLVLDYFTLLIVAFLVTKVCPSENVYTE